MHANFKEGSQPMTESTIITNKGESNMKNAVQTTDNTSIEALNSLIVHGDMSKLTPKQKLDYYHGICKSIGLNPLTNPFQYMRLNGKEVLYATKGAAEQIRNIKGISVMSQNIEWTPDLVIVTVEGKDKDGRIDTETGFAQVGNLKGDAKGNALLKAITKAKRRLTLSMAGLGMLDETEVDSIPEAVKLDDVTKDVEVVENVTIDNKTQKKMFAVAQDPFIIKIPLKGDKPDWAAWARSYSASLQASSPDDFEIWVDMNSNALENCFKDRQDIYDKLESYIDIKRGEILNTESLQVM